MNNTEELEKLRHTCSHLLAAAVCTLWPKAKRAIGPTIENGFYYDFDFGEEKIGDDVLPKIEEEMHNIIKDWQTSEQVFYTAEQAREIYPDNPYKHELIIEFSNKGKDKLSFYKTGDFIDLCKGPHLLHPSQDLKYFKLLSIAGAYWRGSEKNKMLTRIYGTAYFTKKELDEHLVQLQEAKERDHRKIGKDLGLFVFSDIVGKGLPLFTAKGATIRRELEKFIIEEEIKRGYEHVVTPSLARVDLYRKSGHYPYYKDSMYPPMVVDDEELILRPMTCPHHFTLFQASPKSYKDLPVRYAELASQYRYEKSGELTGLTRVRKFCLADAHIFCRPDQAEKEIINVLDLIDYVNKILKLEKNKDYWYRLSLHDPQNKQKYFQDEQAWTGSEQILRDVLNKTNNQFVEASGEAAFYGPKIDVQMRKINGMEETAFTVQYDFVLPKRFDINYISSTGETKSDLVVIHRSSIGALERIMAFLIEHYNGNFPMWLAPEQVSLLPVSDKLSDFTSVVLNILKSAEIRVQADLENKTIGAKIRSCSLQKIPYMCIIGQKEKEKSDISSSDPKKIFVAVRKRGGEDQGVVNLYEFIEKLKAEIGNKI